MAKVTFKHLRALSYCIPAVRRFCAEHGVDIREFREGVDTQRLRATGHRYAIKAAELAEREASDQERDS